MKQQASDAANVTLCCADAAASAAALVGAAQQEVTVRACVNWLWPPTLPPGTFIGQSAVCSTAGTAVGGLAAFDTAIEAAQ